jgi:hypothetical protein
MAATFNFYDLTSSTDVALRSGLEPVISVSTGATDDSRAKEAASKVPEEGLHLSRTSAYCLRAATVDACEYVVKRAHEIATTGDEDKSWLAEMTAVRLDGYLWSVAKDDPKLRQVPRIVEKTVFY